MLVPILFFFLGCFLLYLPQIYDSSTQIYSIATLLRFDKLTFSVLAYYFIFNLILSLLYVKHSNVKVNTVFFLRIFCTLFFLVFIILLVVFFLFFCFVETPVFFFTGFLLYFTILSSVVFFQYLTLYGIFIINFIPLFLFWCSLLYYMSDIFLNQQVYTIFLNKWFFINLNYRVDFYVLIDIVSFSFILLTTSIALFVFIYSFSYFRYEPLVDRFILFLLLFIVSMIFLVSSGNLVMLFLGWELIGLTSFLLINFWVTKVGTLKAAFKAFTFNKISDFWLFLFLILSFGLFYDLDITVINNTSFLYYNSSIRIFSIQVSYIELLCTVLLSAAFIKSAQFGAHIWLPDSMEAPVPASSLIHSATLVSAGIFLVLRFNSLFDNSILTKYLLVIIGSLTAAYGGIAAANQPDVKRILAYSTISHCGFLMVLCFVQINEFTILYLYVHGFFKAAVFMCVGNVIRISRNYQDFRRMGMYWKYLPFESFAIFIGLVNLCGLPFTIGFLIKHVLLLSLHTHIYTYYLVLFFCTLGAIFGLFYSYRVYFNVFFDFKKGKKQVYNHLNKIALFSSYYSNTSLASNIAILFLVCTAYAVSYTLFIYFLSKCVLFSDCFNFNIYSNFYGFFNTGLHNLLNFSIINVIVLLFLIFIVFSNFRQTNKLHNTIYLLSYLLLVLL